MTHRPVAVAVTVLVAATLGAGAVVPAPAPPAAAASTAASPVPADFAPLSVSVASQPTTGQRRPAVVEERIIGYSVLGRPIRAWHLGDPAARVTAVAIASLHGDEAAPRAILEELRDGWPITGVNLWVVPGANPDGFAQRERRNAHGVDLNRNFPWAWRRTDGRASGPRPASEPETRALMRLLRRVDPRFVVSFHQPFHGVDVWRPKRLWFAQRIARDLGLPLKEFPCGGTCHGTFTQWFNHRLDGVAVTVEYGAHPTWRRMHVRAPRQLLRALGGSR